LGEEVPLRGTSSPKNLKIATLISLQMPLPLTFPRWLCDMFRLRPHAGRAVTFQRWKATKDRQGVAADPLEPPGAAREIGLVETLCLSFMGRYLVCLF